MSAIAQQICRSKGFCQLYGVYENGMDKPPTGFQVVYDGGGEGPPPAGPITSTREEAWARGALMRLQAMVTEASTLDPEYIRGFFERNQAQLVGLLVDRPNNLEEWRRDHALILMALERIDDAWVGWRQEVARAILTHAATEERMFLRMEPPNPEWVAHFREEHADLQSRLERVAETGSPFGERMVADIIHHFEEEETVFTKPDRFEYTPVPFLVERGAEIEAHHRGMQEKAQQALQARRNRPHPLPFEYVRGVNGQTNVTIYLPYLSSMRPWVARSLKVEAGPMGGLRVSLWEPRKRDPKIVVVGPDDRRFVVVLAGEGHQIDHTPPANADGLVIDDFGSQEGMEVFRADLERQVAENPTIRILADYGAENA